MAEWYSIIPSSSLLVFWWQECRFFCYNPAGPRGTFFPVNFVYIILIGQCLFFFVPFHWFFPLSPVFCCWGHPLSFFFLILVIVFFTSKISIWVFFISSMFFTETCLLEHFFLMAHSKYLLNNYHCYLSHGTFFFIRFEIFLVNMSDSQLKSWHF